MNVSSTGEDERRENVEEGRQRWVQLLFMSGVVGGRLSYLGHFAVVGEECNKCNVDHIRSFHHTHCVHLQSFILSAHEANIPSLCILLERNGNHC